MYPRIPWELVADTLGSEEHTSGNTGRRYNNFGHLYACRDQMKCDGTCAENKFRLLVKRTCPFKSAGASVQSTTGSRGVRISGSNAGYIMFRGSVKSTGYPLHSPVSPSYPLPCVNRVPSHFDWSLPINSVQF